MELKDVILSTLAEMEEPLVEQAPANSTDFQRVEKKEMLSNDDIKAQSESIIDDLKNSNPDNEMIFLSSIRERLLVLFEGFQAPNNANIEAKVDLTLNFLEYVLATIDSRVEILEKGNKK